MSTFTGRGKVSDNLGTNNGKREIVASLFNFDIAGANVKQEHQFWLDKNAVPVLLASRNTTVAMKGLASRSGSQSFNDKLSQQRVVAVRQHLLGRGVNDSQIGFTWRGEDEAAVLGVKDGNEDEKWRAVAVQIAPPLQVAPVRFERVNPGNRADGFVDDSSTPWMMVPAFGFRRLLFLLNAEGLILETTNPSIVRPVSPETSMPVDRMIVPSSKELLRIEGGVQGDAHLIVRELTGKEVARLDISVLVRKEVGVVFHYVADSKTKTTRNVGDEKKLLKIVNDCYQPQINITFVAKDAKPLKFSQDLSDPLETTTGVPTTTQNTLGGTRFTVLSDKGDMSGRIAVFFVWEYQADPNEDGDTNAEVDDIPGRLAVVEDQVRIHTLSHEFGHCLGLEHNEAATDLIMWPKGNTRSGFRFTKDEILRAHRHADRVRP